MLMLMMMMIMMILLLLLLFRYNKKKRVGESSSGSKCKNVRLGLIDEDMVMEEHGGINPKIFDSGKFSNIDSLDDDSEIELDGTDYF
ncbi:hypothetical protein LguiB_016955 [Lonicera macranthoides]